jgi:hypothetical protein
LCSQNELFLLLCPSSFHHVWIGNSFPLSDAGIEVDDDNKPIMSRLLKWLAKVQTGEVNNKPLVGSGLLNAELAIHL